VNTLATIPTGAATMSSLTIADITGKRHDHVMRDIEKMIDAMNEPKEPAAGASPDVGTPQEDEHHRYDRTQYQYLRPSSIDAAMSHWDKEPAQTAKDKFASVYVNPQNGQSYRCYTLPQRELLILISGYNIKLRAAIIDRWHELEIKQSFQIPTNLPDALRLAADLADERDALEVKLIEAAPKVEFFDRCTESNDVCQMAVAAQVAKLPFGRNILFQKLRELGAFISGGERHNMPKQSFVNRGLFTVNQRAIENPKTGEPIIIHTSYATQKGIAWIIKQFGKVEA